MTEEETLKMWHDVFARAVADGASNISGFGAAAAMVCVLLRDATKARLRMLQAMKEQQQ